MGRLSRVLAYACVGASLWCIYAGRTPDAIYTLLAALFIVVDHAVWTVF